MNTVKVKKIKFLKWYFDDIIPVKNHDILMNELMEYNYSPREVEDFIKDLNEEVIIQSTRISNNEIGIRFNISYGREKQKIFVLPGSEIYTI
jgi:hypothetical protein